MTVSPALAALRQIKALTMDCYGTLIDWETGIWNALQPARDGRPDTRQIALEAFAELESTEQAATPTGPYPTILRTVHRQLCERFGWTLSEALDEEFGRSVQHWPAFPDSTEALLRLQQHVALVVLSNVDRAGFAASKQRLGINFDAVYTAEEIGSYKPADANFEFLINGLDHDLGLGPDDVLHTAQSLFHDHRPATRFGLTTAWIDRQHLSNGGDWGATAKLEERPTTDFVFFSMADLADAIESAHR